MLFSPENIGSHLQVVFSNQFLVRPTNGQTVEKEQKKDRTNATDATATSTAATNSDTVQQQPQQQQSQQQQQTTPEFSFAETVLQKVGKPLKDVIEKVSPRFYIAFPLKLDWIDRFCYVSSESKEKKRAGQVNGIQVSGSIQPFNFLFLMLLLLLLISLVFAVAPEKCD